MNERAIAHRNRIWRVWRVDGGPLPADRAALTVGRLAGTAADTLVWPDGMMVRVEPVATAPEAAS